MDSVVYTNKYTHNICVPTHNVCYSFEGTQFTCIGLCLYNFVNYLNIYFLFTCITSILNYDFIERVGVAEAKKNNFVVS